MDTLLIIDDEAVIRHLLSRMLELEGYEVFEAGGCAEGMRQLKKHRPEVVLCDVRLPDGNGVDLLLSLKKECPDSQVVMLTAHGNIQDGVQAIKNGAFDYITKGDDNNKIIPVVSAAMTEAKRVKDFQKPASNLHTFDTIIGRSAKIQEAVRMATKVAKTDVAVLLTGETGTGKEVFAQAIHTGSPRANLPFMAINCSAFSKDLLESELFGYKAGAFTGAVKDKKGLFEVADKGTVFLDEIGEMAFELQAKLLRVLETGEFIPVGDTSPKKVDVRIISATNRDLKKEIGEERFREDLFYRLSVFQIQLPPLRERPEDIPLLAEHYLRQNMKRLHKEVKGMTPEFLDTLCRAAWKGNVRELKNIMERCMIICDKELTMEDLPLDLLRPEGESEVSSATPLSDFDLATIEQRHISRVLQYTKGNKTEASRLLKIGLTTLYRKIEEYGVK